MTARHRRARTVLRLTANVLSLCVLNICALAVERQSRAGEPIPPDFEGTTWYVHGSVRESGDGSRAAPFRTMQEALNEAAAGDTVLVAAGIYDQPLVTVRDGQAGNPITIRSHPAVEPPQGAAAGWVPPTEEARVWIKFAGRAMDIRHSNIHVDGINVDGVWHGEWLVDEDGIFTDPTSNGRWTNATNGIVRVNRGTENIILRNIEVRNNQQHLVRIHGSHVLVENARIHYGIARVNGTPAPPPAKVTGDDFFNDAHGIVITYGNHVTVRNTYIGYVSGDNVQLERQVWGDFTVEGSQFEIAPLDIHVLGLQPGVWFGEDLFDTKTPNRGRNGTEFNRGVTFRNNLLHGTRYSRISHGAVFNLKEGVQDILIEGNRIFANRMTFRLRQPTKNYVIRNNLIYDNHTALWFAGASGGEFLVENVEIANNTFYKNDIIIRENQGGAGNTVAKNNIFSVSSQGGTLRNPSIVWESNFYYDVPRSFVGPAQRMASGAIPGYGNRTGDPQFESPETGDFRLQPDSPAVGMGAEISHD